MSRRKESSELSVAFGRAIRKLREKGKYTQEDFAHRAGIDRAYYGLMERGGHTPTIGTVWKIAEALGVKPASIVTEVDRQLMLLKTPSADGKSNVQAPSDSGGTPRARGRGKATGRTKIG